jgi:hypothetical protein
MQTLSKPLTRLCIAGAVLYQGFILKSLVEMGLANKNNCVQNPSKLSRPEVEGSSGPSILS